MEQKFRRGQPGIEGKTSQLGRSGGVVSGENFRQIEPFLQARIQPEERGEGRRNFRVLQKFAEERGGYRKAVALVAVERF